MLSHVALNPDGQETVVLLHALGEDSSFYTEQGDIPSLLGDLHFIIPDLPGSGQSQHTRLTSFASAADQVQELILAFARGGRAHVVGFDVGGQVALTLAQLHPGCLHSCIAINAETEGIRAPLSWRPVLAFVMATAMVALTPIRRFPSLSLAQSSFYAELDLVTDSRRLKMRLRNLTYRTLMDYALALRDFKLYRLEPRTLLFSLHPNGPADSTTAFHRLRRAVTLLREGNAQSTVVLGMWKVTGREMRSERFSGIIRSWIKREGGRQGSPLVAGTLSRYRFGV
ncbi:alpha/beta-hydrolase [Auricularia subglabra TFB-10046 SS5]|nr:alpha/beta-hydrolase [Auricularia subglabra TFB-10046 SS5]